MTDARAFRGFRFPAEVILWAVRWYLRFPVSYRGLEAMLADRGLSVDHVSLYRWVQHFAPELERRMRRSRYIGLAKTTFQQVCIAVGMNVSRAVHWLDGSPRAKTRVTRFAALGQTA